MNWRLTSELLAYFVPGRELVYFASLEKKQYQTEVIKLIDTNYQELRLYENQFELKIGGDESNINLYVKSLEFPTPRWYKVMNFYDKGLWKLLETHTIINGCFEENLMFEVCFCDSTPYVSFVEPKMKEFKTYFNEMKRRLNCEIGKKTSKWIPGHRYDAVNETIYYIADVRSKRVDPFNSNYIREFDKMPQAIIYTNILKEEDHSVSDILKNRGFGEEPEDLKVMYKPKSMVDSGSVLDNDFSGNILDYQVQLFNNTKKDSLKNIFDIYSVTNTSDVPVLDESVKTEVKELITDKCLEIILNYWNLSKRTDISIGDTCSEKDNTSNIKKLLISTGIKDGNFYKNLYYPELFKDLGIDLEELAADALCKFRLIDFKNNFDDYLKYIRYWDNIERIDPSKCSSRQRIKSTKYKLDVITLKDLYGDSELTDTIIKTTNSVRSNFGLGAREYSVINIGTKKEPLEYITCTISLDDIIKFKKGISNMSENLKHEIMSYHFVWVQIVFDKEGELK